MNQLWTPNATLEHRSRWWSRLPARSTVAADLAILIALGFVAAAATSLGNLRIPLPGHAILRGTLPLLLGLSLVPRRGSGSIMSASAAFSFAALSLLGVGLHNPAALVGVVVLGPALDVSLANATPGVGLYLRAAIAGMTANLLAFAVRMGSASWLGEAFFGRGFLGFWPAAMISFAVLGAVAGLISAAAWFRYQSRGDDAV